MRIICAPDSFKGSLSASAAAAAMRDGILALDPDILVDPCPVSDGGEGFVEALSTAGGGERCETEVSGPSGEVVLAAWARLADGTAVIEMAAASGLDLVPKDQRDPMRTTTFGTGELIRAALDAGSRTILLGIGGSATTDGGVGMAQALGVVFRDRQGRPMVEPIPGGRLGEIAKIDLSALHPAVAQCSIAVACDVKNPLTGPSGAGPIYGPQKGANAQQVEQLDAGLVHLAKRIRGDLGIDIEPISGAGAAGGLGGGLVAFVGASLQPGVETVLKALDFDQRVAEADLCLTGEGRLDGQTLSGKAILGLAQAAAKHHVPTIALVGSVGEGAPRTLDAGLHSYHVIGEGLSEDQSMEQCEALLRHLCRIVVRDFKNLHCHRPRKGGKDSQ